MIKHSSDFGGIRFQFCYKTFVCLLSLGFNQVQLLCLEQPLYIIRPLFVTNARSCEGYTCFWFVSQSVPKFVSLNYFKPQLDLKRCMKFRQSLLVFRTKYIVCRCAYFLGNSDSITFFRSSALLNLEICRTKVHAYLQGVLIWWFFASYVPLLNYFMYSIRTLPFKTCSFVK